MTTQPKKDARPIPFTLLQAELIQDMAGLLRELAREQTLLVIETVRTIQQLRELHEYVMQIRKSVSRNACNAQAKIIPFPVPPRVTRVRQRPS